MDLRSNLRKYVPLIGFVLLMGLVITGWILYLPTIPERVPRTAQKKAIILCSANDFYGTETEDEFNDGNDATFVDDQGNWTYSGTPNSIGDYSLFGNETTGSIIIEPTDFNPISGEFTLDYSEFYGLHEYALYNLTANLFLQSAVSVDGKGAQIALRWLNSTGGIVRTDKSNSINTTIGKWVSLNIVSVCNNETGNEITDLEISFSFEGTFAGGPSDHVYLDDLMLERLIQVNLTNPTDPPPDGKINSDGFPAQALQVYWILKDNGYTDDNIFLMLYHTGDDIIDIYANDIYTNDLNRSGVLADVDVENDEVNASRFKQELDVSNPDSFASTIRSIDQLLIFMTDHGSNAILPDKNATFHFEADNSHINETEFYDLVKEINCERMLICVDCCFSGNFLNENKNIGQSWYDLPNCIFISSASNVLSWYWINNKNLDGFAGSWFFHPFWEELNKNQTILSAYNFALGFIPSTNFPKPVTIIQNPLMKDNLGISMNWSFNGDPQL
ncbi:MAG: C13 family peptidase [Promethearchaeota archaeon]